MTLIKQWKVALSLFLYGMLVLPSVADASVSSFRSVYNDHTVVDLEFLRTPPSSGSDKAVLRRGSYIIKTFDFDVNEEKYWCCSDSVETRCQHKYYLEYYLKEAGCWQKVHEDQIIVDTSYCQGLLYNGLPNKFGRDPVTWSGEIVVGSTDSTRWLVVAEGILKIEQGATVTLNDNILINFSPVSEDTNGRIEAKGATFEGGQELYSSSIVLESQDDPVNPAFQDCYFGQKVDLYIGQPTSDFPGRGVALIGNEFHGCYIYFYATDSVFSQNKGAKIVYVYGERCIVSDNLNIDLIEVLKPFTLIQGNSGNSTIYLHLHANNNNVISNSCKLIKIQSASNTISSNICNELKIYKDNNDVFGNTLCEIYIKSGNNHIEHNLIDAPDGGTGILLSRGEGNIISSNIFSATTRIDTYIRIERDSDSRNTTIKDNVFYYVESGGMMYHIEIPTSENNLIYNNYFECPIYRYMIRDETEGANRYYIPKTAGTNIVGGPFLGGNYWSNYAGTDSDGDEIGDTPRRICDPYFGDIFDPLPLVIRGQLQLSKGRYNPTGTPIEPKGDPFVVTQIKLSLLEESGQEAEISSMGFTFQGDSNSSRVEHIDYAELFKSNDNALTSLIFVDQATFSGDRVVFNVDEHLYPGDQMYFVLKYKFKYTDEYVKPVEGSAELDMQESSQECQDAVYGARIGPEDITVGSVEVYGPESISGYVLPKRMYYVAAITSSGLSRAGYILETPSQVLTAWEEYNSVCVLGDPAIYREYNAWGFPAYFWIKNTEKIHCISQFANQPHFRVVDCYDKVANYPSQPITEVLDCYVKDGILYFVQGNLIEKPYQNRCLKFEGEIEMDVHDSEGNHTSFQNDVLDTLRSHWPEGVIVARFKQIGNGYEAKVRIITSECTQIALDYLNGNPEVKTNQGRYLVVQYNGSRGREFPLHR